jgi:hypothetical protein
MAFSFSAMAQNQDMQQNKTGDDAKYTKTANDLTQNLSTKVNLTADQREEINSALIDYQKDVSGIDPNMAEADRNGKINELHNGIRTEIEDVLDDNQMTAYNGFKDEWWRNVQTQIHPSTVRQNDTKDKKY